MMTDMMRTDIAAIPENPNDKNYVDIWYEQQKEQFKKEHKSVWYLICKATIGKSGKFLFTLNHVLCFSSSAYSLFDHF